MLSKLRREPDGRKEKERKKNQGEGQNENFCGSYKDLEKKETDLEKKLAAAREKKRRQ